MNRREAPRNAALAMGGFITLPAWAEAWSVGHLQNVGCFLTGEQETLLGLIVDTL